MTLKVKTKIDNIENIEELSSKIDLIVGEVISSTKNLEHNINQVIYKHLNPENNGFFHGVLMSSDIISFGSKLNLLKAIAMANGKNINFEPFQTILTIRNLFAHEIPTVNSVDKKYYLNKRIKYKNHCFWTHQIKEIPKLIEDFNNALEECDKLLDEISLNHSK
ncbi:MAG: hypothetical protein H6502_04650 [Candidatus Woesearchaeota archaeon]|nr:MAG: hypothetical protein H6502_04650 [Candidatus Woesearchaeota archaeon]